MSADMVTAKSTGLAKSGAPVRQLATRLERARQSRNERIARADADYVEAVRRAIAAVSDIQAEPLADQDIDAKAAEATA